MANDLVKTISQSEENLKAFYEIRKIQDDAVEKELIEKLKKELTCFAGDNNFKCDFHIERSGFYVDFINDFLKDNGIVIRFQFEYPNYESFYFGFEQELNNQEPNSTIINELNESFKKAFGIDDTSKYFEDESCWGQEEFIKIQNGTMAELIFNELEILFGIAKKVESNLIVCT